MSTNNLVFSFITLVIVSIVAGEVKTPMKLSCWSEILNYERFKVNIYISARDEQIQLLSSDSPIRPEILNFDPTKRTAVIIHGFMGNGLGDRMNDLKEKLLLWKDMNVLQIGWENGCSNALFYHQAVVNTEYVAIIIRKFFRHLILYWDRRNVKFEQWGALHLIGHSLGAHVAGQASKMLRRFENVTVDRITGLDPAEPCFEVPGFPLRLSKTDARFVDIIHTDSATSINQAFGLRDPIGHADFYVNGGVRQPGCEPKTKLQNFLDYTQLINHILANGQCSHNRAFTLFIESVQQATLGNQCVFYAYPWRLNSSYKETKELISKPCTRQTCSEMGINAEFYEFKTNIQYVPTTKTPPYCRRIRANG
ncbi:hypothetical protein TKK_0014823 [Trichogramma kaykai]|uniref:phospholipase A1 n=1 Tax=Trichogramma kaykai TaxID=54128 RepID=A0ABD2WCI8_9HYME